MKTFSSNRETATLYSKISHKSPPTTPVIYSNSNEKNDNGKENPDKISPEAPKTVLAASRSVASAPLYGYVRV